MNTEDIFIWPKHAALFQENIHRSVSISYEK